MRLTRQDKLALALTSFGSVRALADAVGVSRSTMSRWLREGQDNGVREVPAYAGDAIQTAFEIHRDITREQARIDRIPFNTRAPVYTERKTLKTTGKKGDRAVADHTQYIRPDLRVDTMVGATRSGKYLQASVRSTIDLKRYFKQKALELAQSRGWRTDVLRTNDLARSMLSSFITKEKREHNRIIDKSEPFPLYTQYENISSQRKDAVEAAFGIEDKLRKKHEPAVGGKNTALAEAFLFQLMPHPQSNVNQSKSSSAKQKRASKANKRYIRGAGPK